MFLLTLQRTVNVALKVQHTDAEIARFLKVARTSVVELQKDPEDAAKKISDLIQAPKADMTRYF